MKTPTLRLPLRDFYSVDQVAEALALHVKTVRSYVRNKHLRAVRIGKQYRIPRTALEAFTGQRAAPRRPLRVDVTSVVDIDAVSPDQAARFTSFLLASMKGRPAGDPAVRVDTHHDVQRARLKIVVTGDARTVAVALDTIAMLTAKEDA